MTRRVPDFPVMLPDPGVRVEGQHDDVMNIVGGAIRDTLLAAGHTDDAFALAARCLIRADVRLRDTGHVIRTITEERDPP